MIIIIIPLTHYSHCTPHTHTVEGESGSIPEPFKTRAVLKHFMFEPLYGLIILS